MDGKLYVNPNLPVIEEYELYYELKAAIDNGIVKEGVTFKEIVDAVGNPPRGICVCPMTAEKESVYEVRCLDATSFYRIGIVFDDEEKVCEVSVTGPEEGEFSTDRYFGQFLKNTLFAVYEENDIDKAKGLYERMKKEAARMGFDLEPLKQQASAFIDMDTMTIHSNPFKR